MASASRRILFGLATSVRFERLVRGLPGGEPTAYRLALRYVAGRQRGAALARAHALAAERLTSSIDFFGESVSDPLEAERVTDAYVDLAGALADAPAGTFLALDLSHLGVDAQGDAVRSRLLRIAEALPAGARVQVGAEQAERADRILDTVLAAARAGAGVAATVQANLRRSPADAQRLAEAGVPIRLVKGAYVEEPAIAHDWGEQTDLAFLELAHELHRGGAELTLGTHDPVLREALLRALPGVGVEMLLGVRADDARTLSARNVPVRVYVPYGEAWFRYAMRRLAESRGAPRVRNR
jgi:proline dehydrogenase